MKNILITIAGAGLLLLASCAKDKKSNNASGHVIVLNEGGFNHGDASVSVYDPASRQIINDVFRSQNGFSLGDVAQSIYLIGDTAYIVMNNSQDIVLADASHNFRYISHISIPNSSPRYFIPVSSSKAYVTELYANKIWIIDYRAGVVTGSIPVTGWTEQMVSYNNSIYVTERTTPTGGSTVHKIVKIDPSSDQIVSSVDLATDPESIVLTDDHKLWALGAQASATHTSASLYKLDPASLSILKKIDFDSTQSPGYLRYSSFAHQLLYSNNGIFKMAQSDITLPTTVAIASNGWNVYGLNADPDNGDIYISDAIDYQQASHIMRYSDSNVLLDAFTTGLITNNFVFR